MSQEPPAEALAPLLSSAPFRNDHRPSPPSPGRRTKYYDAFLHATDYDQNRTLWIGDLQPWMDEEYFENICIHFREEVSVTVITNEQTKSPEYAIIQFKSTKAADRILWKCNGFTMPNSTKKFDFRWVPFVCGLDEPDGCFKYERCGGGTSIHTLTLYRTLLSVEFVRVKNIKSAKRPIRIHGTVFIASAYETITTVVYDRSKKKSQSVCPGNDLTLTGPLDYFEADGGFFIVADLRELGLLKDDDDQTAEGEMPPNQTAEGKMPPNQIAEGISSKKRIAEGDMSSINCRFWRGPEFFDPLNFKQRLDQHLEDDIYCEFGSVTVGYSVFKNALNATLQVMLIERDGDESPTVKVHGLIDAVQHTGESGTEITLFKASDIESVRVHSNHHIPLTRPVVVIPDTGLSIDVRLWDTEKRENIADGAEYFVAETGFYTMDIGKVKVFVTIY